LWGSAASSAFGCPQINDLNGFSFPVTVCAALLLLLADHPDDIEIAWVCGCSATLLIAVAVDWQLRRRGLRS